MTRLLGALFYVGSPCVAVTPRTLGILCSSREVTHPKAALDGLCDGQTKSMRFVPDTKEGSTDKDIKF